MAGWRAADQEPVASRHAIDQGMRALATAIEQLAAHSGSRPVVTACWQDEAYLDVPPGLLERLATTCDLTVACAGRLRLDAPDVDHVAVEPGEALGDEWSIVAVTSTGGVALVAREVAASLPAPTVESGRAYRFDTTDDPNVVIAHARRLLRQFGARMAPEAAARLAAATTAFAAGDREHTGDRRTAAVQQVIERGDDARRAETDVPHHNGGLAGLAQWLADAGPRAPSLGIIVARGDRNLAALLREQAHTIGRVGDIIVDVPPDAAMIVLPGLGGARLQERADEVCGLLAARLHGADVDALGVDVPAEHARRDLVGHLGKALATLRQRESTCA